MITQANYVNSITKTKYEGPWQFKERDKFLLRNSDGILLVYDEDTEGSPKFMKLQAAQVAAHHDYPIITINASDLQNVAEDEQDVEHGDQWGMWMSCIQVALLILRKFSLLLTPGWLPAACRQKRLMNC